MRGVKLMGETAQFDWRQLARDQFQGFNVQGSGPFAVVDGFRNVVMLFNFRLEASTKGHVIELQPPAPRPHFRQPGIRD
jgi:hypothetical protein